MNQRKIGKFIAKLRKERKMTQQELAEKLNVTDRAISNWENGRRLPDASFYNPLCTLLGVSLSELMNGERIKVKKKIKVKKSKRILIIGLFCTLLVMILIIISFRKQIDIYSFVVTLSDDVYVLKKKFTYNVDDIEIGVYYYGIEEAELCDSDENCYELETSLLNGKTEIEILKKYFESQYALGNTFMSMFWDGGTKTYHNERYQIMFCNTLDGNRDIYIGKSDMLESLNGKYCGRSGYAMKSYIRTYYVLGSTINKEDDEFIHVTLKQNNGAIGTVTIHKSNNLVSGKTYEFSFYTFDKFEDTIENIFKYSTLIRLTETDKHTYEQINEDVYINEDVNNGAELNELKHVMMTIKEGTLTKTSATIVITDYSGKNYIYGSPYRIDVKTDDIWKPLESICSNCAFNSMAYGVDLDGKLEFDINWERMYGELKKGKYRIVKDAFPDSDRPITEGYVPYYFSVEFVID